MDLQVYGGKERSEGNDEKYNEVKKLIRSLVSYFIFISSCCFLRYPFPNSGAGTQARKNQGEAGKLSLKTGLIMV